MAQPVITLSNLSKKYRDAYAIEEISLDIEKGDFYGFVGPNGAGKSTTMRILLGLIQATEGEARVFNQPVTTQTSSILARIGYIPSEVVFYDYLTVRETILFSARLRGSDETILAESQRLMDKFNIDANKKIKALSLGNRKKVSIICALQHQPDLYIFDEPTSGLDPLMQAVFWEEMQERHQKGATIFVSSHNLTEVQRYCTKAAIISEGKIISAGPMEELRKTSVKRVVIQGITAIPELEEQMKDMQQTQDGISFLYQDTLAQLMTLLYSYKDNILDLSIVEPDLEEVFRHFYVTDKEMRDD